jgi:hypothetical protein
MVWFSGFPRRTWESEQVLRPPVKSSRGLHLPDDVLVGGLCLMRLLIVVMLVED